MDSLDLWTADRDGHRLDRPDLAVRVRSGTDGTRVTVSDPAEPATAVTVGWCLLRLVTQPTADPHREPAEAAELDARIALDVTEPYEQDGELVLPMTGRADRDATAELASEVESAARIGVVGRSIQVQMRLQIARPAALAELVAPVGARGGRFRPPQHEGGFVAADLPGGRSATVLCDLREGGAVAVAGPNARLLRYSLFGRPLEKGVILVARLGVEIGRPGRQGHADSAAILADWLAGRSFL